MSGLFRIWAAAKRGVWLEKVPALKGFLGRLRARARRGRSLGLESPPERHENALITAAFCPKFATLHG